MVLLHSYSIIKLDDIFLGGSIQSRFLYPEICFRAQISQYTTRIPMLKQMRIQHIKNSIYQEKKAHITIQQCDDSYMYKAKRSGI